MAEEKDKEKDVGASDWKDALFKGLVALAPVGIGGALGGLGGVEAGAQAGKKTLSVFEKMDEAEAAKRKAALEQAEKKQASDLALRKQAFEEKSKAEELRIKRMEAQQKLGEQFKPKMLGQEQTQQLSDLDSSEQMLADLGSSIGTSNANVGPVMGRIAGAMPYNTEAQALKAKMLTTTQLLGKALEGGKMTESDFVERYQNILPNMKDTEEVAAAKIAQLKKMIAEKRASNLGTFEQAGYDVRRFAEAKPQAVQEKKQGNALQRFADNLGGTKAVAAEMPDFESMSNEQLKKYLGK
jgi:hypothetical protein